MRQFSGASASTESEANEPSVEAESNRAYACGFHSRYAFSEVTSSSISPCSPHSAQPESPCGSPEDFPCEPAQEARKTKAAHTASVPKSFIRNKMLILRPFNHSSRRIYGLQMRYCRPPERRQEHYFQCNHQCRRGSGELSLLHHRTERRHGERPGFPPR